MSRPFGYALAPKGLELQFPGGDDATWNDDHASAIETLVTEHGDELFEIVRAALERWVTEMEAESASAAEKNAERTKEENAEAMRVYYGDDYGDDSGQIAVDEEVVGLFDDPEDVVVDEILEEDLGDEEPFYTRYTLQTVYVHGPETFGISGSCDWDPEHGVGVRLKGLEVIEVGPASDAF